MASTRSALMIGSLHFKRSESASGQRGKRSRNACWNSQERERRSNTIDGRGGKGPGGCSQGLDGAIQTIALKGRRAWPGADTIGGLHRKNVLQTGGRVGTTSCEGALKGKEKVAELAAKSELFSSAAKKGQHRCYRANTNNVLGSVFP